MAVRFLPPPEEPSGAAREDRPDLAEVIELRSRLVQQAWNSGTSADGDETAGVGGAHALAGESGRAPEAASNAGANEQTGSWLSGAGAAGESEGDGRSAQPRVSGLRAVAQLPVSVPASTGTDTDTWSVPGENQETRRTPTERGPRFSSAAGVRRARQDASEPTTEPGYFDEIDEAHEACNAAGVKLMARKARSSGELREELLRLDHAAHIVDGVIAEFEQSLYLDDAGLARTVTEKLRNSKKASRSQIRIKLRERRLPDSVIEAAVSELDVDEEFDLLREAAQDRARKMDGLDRQTAERRLLGFLARRGWSGEPATRAVREALDGGPSGSGFSARGTGPRFQ